jgi:hypothetical protein
LKAGVTIGFLLVLLSLLVPFTSQVDGQGQFLTYRNPDYDIAIQYPSDWTVSEDNLRPHQVVWFSAPEIEVQESSVSTVIYIPAQLGIGAPPLYSANMSIDQFTDQFLNETYSSPSEYRIIESSNDTLNGMHAKKIIMYEYVGDRTSKVMRIIGMQNGTAFVVKYMAEPGQYSTYLPIAEQMIDTFSPSATGPDIVPVTQQPSNISSTNNPGVPLPSITSTSNNTITNNSQQLANITTTNTSQPVQSPPRQPQEQEATEILLRPKSGESELPNTLPKTLIVTDNIVGDSRLPLRSSIVNGNETGLISSEPERGELYDWYPAITFHFNDPTALGLVNIKHVLAGPIKSYDSPNDILEDANYWKDLALNEQVVLEMNQPGLNYLIASVQFANGTSGIYSAIMNVDASNTKSSAEDFLDFQMDEGEDFNVVDKAEIGDIESDPQFQRAASAIICSDLDTYGFQVCRAAAPSDPSMVESQQPSSTASDDITSLFDNGGEDEDEEDNNNGDDNDDNDDNDNDN